MKRLTIRELLKLEVDVDIYNDVTDEVAPAFCGSMKLTDEGVSEFFNILDIEGELSEEDCTFTLCLDKRPDWNGKLCELHRFFACIAGYCGSDSWNRWFVDG